MRVFHIEFCVRRRLVTAPCGVSFPCAGEREITDELPDAVTTTKTRASVLSRVPPWRL